jgi:hypothetical protein
MKSFSQNNRRLTNTAPGVENASLSRTLLLKMKDMQRQVYERTVKAVGVAVSQLFFRVPVIISNIGLTLFDPVLKPSALTRSTAYMSSPLQEQTAGKELQALLSTKSLSAAAPAHCCT